MLPLERQAAQEKLIKMAEEQAQSSTKCEHHWHYVKRGDSVVCEECDDPIENNAAMHAIGSDHWIRETTHACTAAGGESRRFGFIVMHIKPDGRECDGAIRTCTACDTAGRPVWDTQDANIATLTLSPSLQCGLCPDHGFIRAGQWVRA